jgi:RND family efflux transporter MFP subunit
MLTESVAARSGPELSSTAWAQFASAQELGAFCEAWLRLQCIALQSAGCEPVCAVVIWQTASGGYGPVALWPTAHSDASHLGDTARKSLGERRGLCERRPLAGASGAAGLVHAEAAYPVLVEGQAVGVAVIELEAISDAALQRALQQMHWGAGWLESRARALASQAAQAGSARSAQAIDLLAAVGEQDSATQAAMALVNDLASRLGAARVLLGFEHRGHLRLEAISHVAWFDRRSQEIARAENLMEEALDQGTTVAAPPLADQQFRVTVAHDEQRVAAGLGAIVTVLLVGRRGTIGTVTAEWPASSGVSAAADAVPLLEAAALLCGPAFEDKLERNRWISGRIVDGLRAGVRRLGGRGHASFKLGAIAMVVAAVVLSVAEMEYRVTAKSVIEGVVQRAAVAPFRGFVASAPVRAGSQVRKGELLAVLDDRDLRLEQARNRSEVDQAEQKYHDANARRDRPAAAQAAAQQRQAQAQLDLVDEKLARARITAPIDGLVVSGDLTQLLGSPVEQGQTLFEVAPLDAYRVILRVDERDIGELKPGQRGQLVLTGLSKEPLPFLVRTITAVAEPGDGKNLFRVEAELDRAVPYLRPGMEGVGKVEVGERKVLWVWTHGLADWVRLTLWRWSP